VWQKLIVLDHHWFVPTISAATRIKSKPIHKLGRTQLPQTLAPASSVQESVAMMMYHVLVLAASAATSTETTPLSTSYTIGGSAAADAWWPEFDGK